MERQRNRGINRKQEEELRAFFRTARQPDIDEERKRQTLEFLKMERKHLRVRTKKPYRKRVLEQMEYLSPAAWFLQGFLVLVLGFLFCLAAREVILISLLFYAPMVGIVGFSEILRSFRQDMWELEQACRYNLRQLMGMRLLIFAVVDSFVAGGVLITGVHIGIKLRELLVFFLVPQVLSDCVYLYLMTRFRRRFQTTALIGAAIAMEIFWTRAAEAMLENPMLLDRVSDPVALLAMVLVSAGLLALSCVRFLKEIEMECCGTGMEG